LDGKAAILYLMFLKQLSTPFQQKDSLLGGGGFKYFFMFIPIWGRFPF